MLRLLRTASIAIVIATLAGCALGPTRTDEASDREAPTGSFTVRLIGERTLDHRLQFGGTIVGGLSGIDYDPAADVYYLISDDRSVFSPARFYTARLTIDEGGLDDVTLQTVVVLKQPDGTPYPVDASDSESIRYDPRTRSLWWTSEGARKLRGGRKPDRLIDPFVRRAGLDGRYLGEVPLHPMFHIVAEARGPRDNLVFEGSTLSTDGQALYVSMEGPLLQDGPMPTMTDGAWSRISRYDRDPLPAADGGFGALAAQFAYRIGPIPADHSLTSLYAQNGVSEILALDATRLLVLERALVLGAGWRIRLFEADLAGASDVGAIDSLIAPARPFVPMTKRLVLDFDTLGIRIDNLEGICFGPVLANGHRTLVLVSDDNFSALQKTQFVALEIIPREEAK